MNYTEEQIIEKAKQIMKDLRQEFYSEECINGIFFTKEKRLLFGENKDKFDAVWSVGISSFFDNVDFLHISDETGEPLYYQNFNTFVFDIGKDTKERYFKIEEEQ
ncbi:hypothetical protein [Winogradskyella sp. SYSU M77433]|uniref:hypothetical protein n=1 Tax=Winogradskyella sp. SYSU M77433 TaxID=3042722 RepID=UPI002480D982|nr:hypothetical protein [Winogradskyella sp. SYSU M77433]MDH7913765.1 hypothetical protein [Winogradskyella sp. SYSU M77433]